ncbi:MAG: hypothetical protein PVI66_04865 [Candidatus Aminicenantes bacterium]|jgi:hypothetical protein
MSLENIFAWMAGFFFVIFLVSFIMIINFLEKRNVKINYFLIRFLMWKYVSQYKKITLEETGIVGSLYSIWTTSALLMLGSVAAALLVIVSR